MAITNNNVQNVKFLRNQNPYVSREAARQALENNKGFATDGTALLARYEDGNTIKTIVGFVAESGNTKYITIIDVDGSSADIQEIWNTLGEGVSTASTVSDQLEALRGDTASTSADTSVEGAKKYADGLIGTLDYTGVTTGDGVYVTNVTQADGIVAATTATLPSSADTAVAKKVVIAVSEDKGQIEVSRGEITSTDNTIVLTDGADGGIDFSVNVDNDTLVVNTGTGVISVASSALVQYEGDDDTIQISAAEAGVRTVSSPLTIQKITTGLSEEVREEYHLVGASGTTIGDPVKIYKDSHIVSIDYIDDPADEHYQNLEYVYVNDSGATSTTYVDMSELVLEAEFASGLTIENHVARGVVDPTSEKDSQDTPVDFLTVGANGFKVSGIKDEIDRQLDAVVADLDATVTGATSGSHVTISIEELDGKLVQSGLTIEENDIASASDLAELSGKTVTAITSSNSSITASIDDAAGCKSYDIITDASKIKMSGFTSDSVLSGITSSSSITDAFGVVEDVIEENERVTAEALTDLDSRIDTVSGDVDTIKSEYISGVSVNGVAVTPANKVAPIAVSSSTSAATASSTEAIVVTTDQNTGAITLGLAGIDCGYYDGIV